MRASMTNSIRQSRGIGNSRGAAALLAMLLASAAQPAFAQDKPAADDASNPNGEITVTARKIKESLQDVPLSVSALSADKLAEAGSNSLADTIALVPNVAIGGGIAGVLQGQIGIRGISTLVRNPGVESGIGIYVDGVYIGRSDNYNQELIDTAQIEVLRGPQGTLFGKNTIAGVFNITTARPTGKLEGTARLEVGDYGLVRTAGYVMGPLAGEKLQAKLSLGYVSRDGVYKNLSGGKDGDGLDLFSYRGTLYFQPSDTVEVDLSADGLVDRGNPAFFQVVDLAYVDVPMEHKPLTIQNNLPDTLRRDNYGFAGTIKADLGGVNLTSITSYRRSKFTATLDDDQSPYNFVSLDRWSDTTNLFSQELRADGAIGSSLSYVAGLYYAYQKVTTDRVVALGDFLIPGDPAIYTKGNVTSKSYAAFANLTWKATDALSVDVGLRYTKEDKHADFVQSDNPAGFGALIGLPALSYDKSTSDDDVSPTATISYKFTPDVMGYVRYARGFKSASFNVDLVSSTNGLFAGPEKATTYEAGLKTQFLRNAVRLNVAGFTTKYDDMQVSQLLGSGVTLDNAGKATINGFEAELSVTPVRGLTLNGSTGYLDAKYDRYDNCSIPSSLGGGVTSCSGNRIVGAPEWTWHADLQYAYPVSIGDIVFWAGYSGQSKVYYEATNSDRFSGGVRNVFDVRLGLRTGHWDLFGWVKNLTDDRYVTYSDDRSSVGVLKTAAYGEPRTYGATLTVHF